MYPSEITILTKKLKVVETANQFRKENGNRRIGQQYWVAAGLSEGESSLQGGGPTNVGMEGVIILIQYTITKDTDTSWLVEQIKAGRVYLTEDTHLLTLAVAKTLKS